ncbi:MAG: hypothetical protein LBH19_02110 [Dysgonamonadaceae bacterium]|jgi:hypothetical protein|nr:hypothetical protein [Dysgonamonadaceae bacterium]
MKEIESKNYNMGNIDYRIAEDGTIIRGESTNTRPKPPQKSNARLIALLLLPLSIVGGMGIGYYLNNQPIKPQEVQLVEVVPVKTVPDFPNEQRIKDFVKSYYAIFGNNEYYKLDNFFAETVTRYFKETNVKGATLKERYRKYHEKTLGTKSISFSVRWNTFTQQQINNNIVEVNFIMDYYLNTKRYGNQKYVLKIKMDINSGYKIVGISEDTIERQNL